MGVISKIPAIALALLAAGSAGALGGAAAASAFAGAPAGARRHASPTVRWDVVAGQYADPSIASTVIDLLDEHGFTGFTYGRRAKAVATPGTIGTRLVYPSLATMSGAGGTTGTSGASGKGASTGHRSVFVVSSGFRTEAGAKRTARAMRLKGLAAFLLPASQLPD